MTFFRRSIRTCELDVEHYQRKQGPISESQKAQKGCNVDGLKRSGALSRRSVSLSNLITSFSFFSMFHFLRKS